MCVHQKCRNSPLPSEDRWRETVSRGFDPHGQRPGKQSLTVTVLPSCEQEVLVIRVVGEVDLATSDWLRECLEKHLPGSRPGVVLDCTEVSFLAVCGIGLLIEMADQARTAGVAMRLVAQSRVVLRALEVTEADKLVPRAATVVEAVAQCTP